MYKLILKTLLFLDILIVSLANNIRSINRQLEGADIVSDKIRCINFNNTCICPGDCMDLDNKGYCTIRNCWFWDNNENLCIEQGPDYDSALIWQSIPFTGIFGAGFGNMGRWDIFAYGSIMWGVGSLIPCILFCIYLCTYIETDPLKVLKIYFIFFCCVILGYYSWGIYVIATKQITGPKGCSLIEKM